MRPLLLILTDSVALPRQINGSGTSWEDTYIHRLRSQYPRYEIVNVSIGGASIRDLRNQINYYKILKPELVVLQCGIVDAAPRAFGRIEMELIKKLHLFRLTKPFTRLLRKYRSHHYASPQLFERCLREMINAFGARQFISVGIIPGCADYEARLPGVTRSIETYNSILARHTHFISLEAIPRGGVLDDHHHVNRIGLDYIFQRLSNCIPA